VWGSPFRLSCSLLTSLKKRFFLYAAEQFQLIYYILGIQFA
jgi:hypothetical protein